MAVVSYCWALKENRNMKKYMINEWWWNCRSANKCENNLTWAWDREKNRVSTGFEPMTSQTPGGCSIYRDMRTHGEQGNLTEFLWNIHAKIRSYQVFACSYSAKGKRPLWVPTEGERTYQGWGPARLLYKNRKLHSALSEIVSLVWSWYLSGVKKFKLHPQNRIVVPFNRFFFFKTSDAHPCSFIWKSPWDSNHYLLSLRIK